MKTAYYTQLRAMIARLESLRGVALLEETRAIIELALANSDAGTVADFSRHLITIGSENGRLDYEMIGFGHLKALFERDSNYADLRGHVLWYYKWIAERLPEYVEIPAAQVESFLDQMELAYDANGEGLRPVYEQRCRAAAFMGRADEAEEFAHKWQAAPKAASDNCPACETHSRVQYLLDVGKMADAINAAEPVLSGDQSCDEVPATTFSRLLVPLLFSGNPAMAVVLASAVRQQVRHTPSLLSHYADHVVFLTLLGVWEPARRTVMAMLARGGNANNAFVRFCVARSAWLCFARMQKAGVEAVRFVPRTELAGQTLSMGEAAGHFKTRARELADAFDLRNNTPRFAHRLQAIEQIAQI